MDIFLKASGYTNYFTSKMFSLSTPNIREDFVAADDKGLLKTEKTAEISRADGSTLIFTTLQTNMVTYILATHVMFTCYSNFLLPQYHKTLTADITCTR